MKFIKELAAAFVVALFALVVLSCALVMCLIIGILAVLTF